MYGIDAFVTMLHQLWTKLVLKKKNRFSVVNAVCFYYDGRCAVVKPGEYLSICHLEGGRLEVRGPS